MKIDLISIHIKESPQAMPLGAVMIKSMLDSICKFKGFIDVRCDDYYLWQHPEFIGDAIISHKPDSIGFSVYLWNVDYVIKIAERIKKHNPGICIFAGGAQATSSPEQLIDTGYFDFVIKGEGELAITEAVGRMLENIIPEKEIISIPVTNLDVLPSPFLNGTINLQNYEGVLWELSRGCPFKCDFCFESRGVSEVRKFSIDRIRSELKLFEKHFVTQVFVLDPTFNKDKERAKKILRLISEIAPEIHFIFEVRAEFIDREMAKLFRSINCSLQIGLQSSDKNVLSNVNRVLDISKFKEKIGILNQENVAFGLDLIFGLPEDTLNGFKKSLDFAIALQPDNLDIFPLAVLPGTVLFDKADSFHIDFLKKTPYFVISTPTFSADDISKARNLTESCNVFYNHGKAVGWLFMILETLNITASDFFEKFAVFILNHKKMDVCTLQCDFVKELFYKYNRTNLCPPMLDIIRYNNSLNKSLEAGPEKKIESSRIISKNSVLRIAKGTFSVTLNFDLDDLLSIGEVTLANFVKHYRPEKTEIITYNSSGNSCVLPLDQHWVLLLKAIDGKRTFEQVLKSIHVPFTNEVIEFVEYGIESGFLKI